MSKPYFMYGIHACEAALRNAEREIKRVLATPAAYEKMGKALKRHNVERMRPEQLDKMLPRDATHQGIALEVMPLESHDIATLLDAKQPLAILDQITDPHNVGAILRSAAAFGVGGLIYPKDHAAPESGAMAKAACGGLEVVPRIEVTNLANCMAELKEAGYWLIGMDGEAKAPISVLKDYAPAAMVLGAEGKGMRRLTAKSCDVLVHIPINPLMESLNVSNAAAIAFYALNA